MLASRTFRASEADRKRPFASSRELVTEEEALFLPGRHTNGGRVAVAMATACQRVKKAHDGFRRWSEPKSPQA